jgi:pSer/pThr/pTyr-binding forkhead associated (FHA) protein
VDDQTVLAGSQPQASLVVSQGAQVGTTFSITGSEVILGREEGIGIAVPDPEVSRQHARVVWQGGDYYLEDLGSTNGTFLNGTPVTGAQILRAGDSIGIGQTLLVFQTQPGAIPAEAVAAPAAAYPTQAPPPAPAPAPVEQKRGGSRCLLWGCGCLFLLSLFFIILAVIILIVFAAEIQPLFDDLGVPVQLTMDYASRVLI